MMNTFTETTKLKELGLEEKQSQIYLTLLKNGVLSPLELSRLTDLNRTTVYRILEELENKGLVEEVVDGKSVKAKAASPDKLRLLLISEETKLQRMKNTIPDLITKLSVVKDVPSSSTKVFYFRGKTGIQQLLWNTLKGSTLRESSTKENVGFGYMGWNESVGLEFADELRREYLLRKVYDKEILNTNPNQYSYTGTKVSDYNKSHQERYIPKEKLAIHHDTYIYNDVMAFTHFYQGEFFGIEIHNKEIAETQRQVFYILWDIAKEINLKKQS